MKSSNQNNLLKDLPRLGLGMIGCGTIAASNLDGIKRMVYIFEKPPAQPELIKVCEASKDLALKAKQRFGFSEYCIDWKELVNDDRVDILYITGPNNLHAEVCIAAAGTGKNLVCEKPLARNAIEARTMLDAVNKTGVKHLCNFILRMVPALAFARNLVFEGRFGEILSFNAVRLLDHLLDPEAPLTWRLNKDVSGSGVVGDLLSHMIDLARWFCGEPVAVTALNKIFIKERPVATGSKEKARIGVEDDAIALFEFQNGATGFLGASGIRSGRGTAFADVEISAERGSIHWNFDDMNKIQINLLDNKNRHMNGFKTIEVSSGYFPYYNSWHYPGFRIGFNDLFINTAYSIVNSVTTGRSLEPMVATFEDGYRAAVICDAVIESSESGKKVRIEY